MSEESTVRILEGRVLLKADKGKGHPQTPNVEIEVIAIPSVSEIIGYLKIPKFQGPGFKYASKEDIENNSYFREHDKSLIQFINIEFWEIVDLIKHDNGKVEIRLKKS